MGLTFERKVIISQKFKKFIQSGNYEKFILSVMNKSKKFFPNTYLQVKGQSNGECDFIDSTNFEKYDAKLVITEKQGKLLGSRNASFEEWVATMLNEIDEFNSAVGCYQTMKVEDLSLYKIISKILNKIEKDENAILFIPFPITEDNCTMIYGQFAVDILSIISNKLLENQIICSKNAFAIYPCYDKSIAIRNLKTNIREYVHLDELKEYIDFDETLIK